MRAADLRLGEQATARVANGGAPPALEIARLYAQHHRLVASLCRLLLRDPIEAEDATQQTFLLAFSSLIDGTVPRNPAPWLAMIARRECWARTARRRELPLDEERAPALRGGDPLDEAIRKADLVALWRAIASLPRQQRSAFLMREFSGLSYAEVADALGATESAVESLLVRARRQLRDGLESIGTATNLALTPLVLVHHRLARLFGGRGGTTAGGAALAGIPAAAKLAAATVAVVALGSAGAGLGVAVVQGGGVRSADPAQTPPDATWALASASVSRVPASVTDGPGTAVFGGDPARARPDAVFGDPVPAGILAPPPAADPVATVLSAPAVSPDRASAAQPPGTAAESPPVAPSSTAGPAPAAATTTGAAPTADATDPATTDATQTGTTPTSGDTTNDVAASTAPPGTDSTATDTTATDATATDTSATDTTQTDTTP